MLTKWCCHTQSQLTNNISPLGPYLHVSNKKSLSWFFAPTHPHSPIPNTFMVWYFAFRLHMHILKGFFFFFVFPLIILLTFIYSCLYLDTYHFFIICRFFKNWKNNSAIYLWFFLSLLKHLFIKKRVNFSIRILDHTYMEICVGRNSLVYKLKAANF